MNRGAHRAVGNVEARESVASAASRCFIIGTGMMRCPKGSGRDRNTQEREEVVLLTIQQLSSQGTHARDKQGCNIDILDDGSLSFNRSINFPQVFMNRGGARPHSTVVFDLTDPENPKYDSQAYRNAPSGI